MITCYPNENNILEYEEKNIDNKATGFASTEFRVNRWNWN